MALTIDVGTDDESVHASIARITSAVVKATAIVPHVGVGFLVQPSIMHRRGYTDAREPLLEAG